MRILLRGLGQILTRREKLAALALLVLMTLGAALEALGLALILPFLALLNEPERVNESDALMWLSGVTGASDADDLLIACAGAMLGVYVFKNLFLAWLKYAQFRFIFGQQVRLSKRLLTVYLGSPYTFHVGVNTAQLLRNLTDEVRAIFANVFVALANLLTEGLVVIVVGTVLVVVEPVTALAAIGSLGLVAGLFYLTVRRSTARLGKQKQRAAAKHIRAVQESMGSIKELKVLGRERAFIDRFTEAGWEFAEASQFHRTVREFPRLFIETLAIGSILVVVLFTLGRREGLERILPVLGLFALAAVRLMPSLNRLIGALTTLRLFAPSVQVISRDLSALGPSASIPEPTSERLPVQEDLTLESVTYRYPEAEEDALRAISLRIPRGHSVAFVGPSGAGKTTIVDVILGVLAPTEGSVRVDGVDIHARLRAWQEQIGYVPQPVYLMDATIRENIAFGLPGDAIDDAKVWAALEAAALKSHVESLPERLETRIGEHGVRFSGGQRQRLGIARALYHDPDVLVLDEATSALDNETEREITAAIQRLQGTKTVLLIAHRLTTVEKCDQLFLLVGGELRASGTYEELLETSEEFQRLARAAQER